MEFALYGPFNIPDMLKMQKSAGNGEIRRFFATVVKMMTLTIPDMLKMQKSAGNGEIRRFLQQWLR